MLLCRVATETERLADSRPTYWPSQALPDVKASGLVGPLGDGQAVKPLVAVQHQT